MKRVESESRLRKRLRCRLRCKLQPGLRTKLHCRLQTDLRSGARRETDHGGFSLIEILVALAVTAILAGIAWPSYVGILTSARRSEGRSALLQAMQQQERYYTSNNTYATFSPDSPFGFKWHSGEIPSRSAYALFAIACDDAPLATCVRLEAHPGAEGVNNAARDPDCGVLRLDSRGVRTADGDDEACWR